jgi:hypothetical protein
LAPINLAQLTATAGKRALPNGTCARRFSFPSIAAASRERGSLSIVGCDPERQSLYGSRGGAPVEFVQPPCSLDHPETFVDRPAPPRLPVPARMLSPLVPLHQDHRCNDDNRRSHEAKWLKRKSTPMKQKNVADPNGDGRENDDKERAIHGKNSSAGVPFTASTLLTSCRFPRPLHGRFAPRRVSRSSGARSHRRKTLRYSRPTD